MSGPELYVQAELLVSRQMTRIGGSVSPGPFCFFRSMEEYEAEALKKEWKSVSKSWCVKPVLVKVYVMPSELIRFREDNEPLGQQFVLYRGAVVDQVSSIGK